MIKVGRNEPKLRFGSERFYFSVSSLVTAIILSLNIDVLFVMRSVKYMEGHNLRVSR